LRPVQIWVADVRAPQFAAAAHAQSAAIAGSEADADDQAFVDAISWDQDEDRGNPGGEPGAEPAGDPGAERRQRGAGTSTSPLLAVPTPASRVRS